MPGLERILDDGNEIGSVGAVIVQAPGDPTPHALLNARGQLEEVRLDGSGEWSLTTTSPCAGTPADTPDDQWGACLSNDTYGHADQVEIVSLAAGTSQHDEIRLLFGFYYGMVWSPDGTQLEIAVKSSDALLVDEHVAVTSSMLTANANSVIPSGQFVSAPIGASFGVSDSPWNPQTGTLVLISNSAHADGKMLRYNPTPTGQVGSWFVISDTQHTLLRLAWSPDGRQLLLIVEGPLAWMIAVASRCPMYTSTRRRYHEQSKTPRRLEAVGLVPRW